MGQAKTAACYETTHPLTPLVVTASAIITYVLVIGSMLQTATVSKGGGPFDIHETASNDAQREAERQDRLWRNDPSGRETRVDKSDWAVSRYAAKPRALRDKEDLRQRYNENNEQQHMQSEVDHIVESLTLGNIAYNAPSSMRCDQKARIQLLLSPRTAIEELKQKMSGLGEKVGARIRVADVMEADLYGRRF